MMALETVTDILGVAVGGALLVFSRGLVSRMSLFLHRWIVRVFIYAAIFFIFAEVVALLEIFGGSTRTTVTAENIAEMLVAACIGLALYVLRRSEREEISDLLRLANVDDLTALPSRSFFRRAAARRFALSLEYEMPLACLLLDIDDFKLYNDEFGHEAGDDALRCTAQTLRECARADDLAARVGGEEFVLLINGDLSESAAIAERVRQNVHRRCRPELDPHLRRPITVSIGVAAVTSGVRSLDDLLRAADSRMYEAKRAGKNRVFTPDA